MRITITMLTMLLLSACMSKPQQVKPQPLPPAAIKAGQVWNGTYDCNRSVNTMRLIISHVDRYSPSSIYNFSGRYEFTHKRENKSGVVSVSGRYDRKKDILRLNQGDWIEKPSGSWKSVSFYGELVSNRKEIRGWAIDNKKCKGLYLILDETTFKPTVEDEGVKVDLREQLPSDANFSSEMHEEQLALIEDGVYKTESGKICAISDSLLPCSEMSSGDSEPIWRPTSEKDIPSPENTKTSSENKPVITLDLPISK